MMRLVMGSAFAGSRGGRGQTVEAAVVAVEEEGAEASRGEQALIVRR
jgi:hypothetical protein